MARSTTNGVYRFGERISQFTPYFHKILKLKYIKMTKLTPEMM